MISAPAVTVVMPAHNVEDYIAAAISSILNQTFEDFELWVLENGSSDKTAEVAAGFSDPRVKVFRLGAVGFQGALSYALEHTKSDWIARMDADDLSLPTRLEKQINVVKERPEYVVVGTAFGILTPAGHIIERRREVPSRELDKTSVALAGHKPEQPRGRISADASMLFNRKAAVEAGGYDSAFTMGDVPLWLRMLDGRKGWEISESLYLYRLRPNSFSATHREGIEVRAKYTPDLLEDFLTFCYGKGEIPKENGRSLASYWRHIGFLELLAGDKRAALQAAEKVEAAGNRRSAQVLRLRAHAGKLGHLYYNRQWALSYRHRPDWEGQMATLL